MSKGYINTDQLLDSIKRRAMIPTSQDTFSPTDLLNFANEEMDIGLVPSILSVHEEFFVRTETIPLEANKTKYKIPYRSIGNKLRDVHFINENGDYRELSRSIEEDKVFYNNGSGSHFSSYIVEGNYIKPLPTIGDNPVSGSIEMVYFIRPSNLVETDKVGIISAINRTSGVVTLTNFPTEFTASEEYDFLEAKSGHTIYSFDITPSSINVAAKTLTFNVDDIPDELEIGDHIALAGESIIPQVPSDLHVVLAQRVACRCLEALGDNEGLAAANAKLSEMETKIGYLIDNRTEGDPQKAVNRYNLVRQGKGRWGSF